MPHGGALPSGVVQDPRTGKFTSIESMGFDDIETVTFDVSFHFDGHTVGTDSTQYDKISEFQGIEVLDMDDILDRHRVAELIFADVGLSVSAYHNGTGVSTYMVGVELSSSPSLKVVDIASNLEMEAVGDVDAHTGDLTGIDHRVQVEDTLDIVVRPLVTGAHADHADAADSEGGGGSSTVDRATGPAPGTTTFDRRDELFVNGEVAQDGTFAGSGVAVYSGILSFGVVEE